MSYIRTSGREHIRIISYRYIVAVTTTHAGDGWLSAIIGRRLTWNGKLRSELGRKIQSECCHTYIGPWAWVLFEHGLFIRCLFIN